jgi:chorismate-pyruvate lyase
VLIRATSSIQGTVTSLIEHLAGEVVFADKLMQVETSAPERNGLDVECGHPLTHRRVILRGCRSNCPYLEAETWFVPDRLPTRVREQLEGTDEPIGRVLVRHHLPIVRSEVSAAPPVTKAPTDVLHARRYRIEIGGEPVIAVFEWFLVGLAPFCRGADLRLALDKLTSH